MTENDNDSHSQTQDYYPHYVPDVHNIMMKPNYQNADPKDNQNHKFSGIGTFTQCRLCDMYDFIIRFQ